MTRGRVRVRWRQHGRFPRATLRAGTDTRDERAWPRTHRAALELLPLAATILAHDSSEEERDRAAGKRRPRGWKARTPHHAARRRWCAVTRRERRAAKRHSARSVALRGRIASLRGSPIILGLLGVRSVLCAKVVALCPVPFASSTRVPCGM